jgi:hypothetical protein
MANPRIPFNRLEWGLLVKVATGRQVVLADFLTGPVTAASRYLLTVVQIPPYSSLDCLAAGEQRARRNANLDQKCCICCGLIGHGCLPNDLAQPYLLGASGFPRLVCRLARLTGFISCRFRGIGSLFGGLVSS